MILTTDYFYGIDAAIYQLTSTDVSLSNDIVYLSYSINDIIISSNSQMSNLLSEEIINRVSGDDSLASDLSSEVSNRISGDASLSGAVQSIYNDFSTQLTLNDLLINGNTIMLGNLSVIGEATSVIFNTINVDISDNLLGLNVGTASQSINYRDTGVIIERGTSQNNVFVGYDETIDAYTIQYTKATTDFSGNDVDNQGYLDLYVKNIYLNNRTYLSTRINLSKTLSSETIQRESADTSLSTGLSSEVSQR